MATLTGELQREYASALARYLEGGGEAALHEAYELGRKALSRGLGVLDLASLHGGTLVSLWRGELGIEAGPSQLEEAQAFFLESLSPFEMIHRGVQESNTALRQMNELLERETRRIARELHDEAGQFLVSVHIALERVFRDLPAGQRSRLGEVRKPLEDMEHQLRRLSHELRPTALDDVGLVPALEFLAEGIRLRTGLQVHLTTRLDGQLPPSVETAVYRVIQEALTNAGRHARASTAEVRLMRAPRRIDCTIIDDGEGFEAAEVIRGGGQGGLGLVGAKERLEALGGTFQVTSLPGRGTQLMFTIPLED